MLLTYLTYLTSLEYLKAHINFAISPKGVRPELYNTISQQHRLWPRDRDILPTVLANTQVMSSNKVFTSQHELNLAPIPFLCHILLESPAVISFALFREYSCHGDTSIIHIFFIL